ncbi:MAG: hypothetical protein PWP37_1265 [Thermotogota bacterium]|nr:hypothetical protein [Thermotogota bacterium]MDK2865073.1 hypothetical protein [Thermotogota bacterium]
MKGVDFVKARFLMVLLFSITIVTFAISYDLLKLVPQDSSFVFLLSDNAKNYDELKNVPLFSTLLTDLGLELMVQQQLEVYRYSQNIDLDSFYKFFSRDMVLYLTENGAGLLAGPFEDPQKVANALSQVLKLFEVSVSPMVVENCVEVYLSDSTVEGKRGFSIPENVLEKIPSNVWGMYYENSEELMEAYGWFAVDGKTVKGQGTSRIEDKSLKEAIEKTPGLVSLKSELIFPDFAFVATVPGDVLETILSNLLTSEEDTNEIVYTVLDNMGNYMILSGNVEFVMEEEQQNIVMWRLIRLNTRLEKSEFEKLMKENGYHFENGEWVSLIEGQTLRFAFDEKRSEILMSLEPLDAVRDNLKKTGIPISDVMNRFSIPDSYRGLAFVDTGGLLEKFIGMGVDSYFTLTVHQDGDTIVSEFTLQ